MSADQLLHVLAYVWSAFGIYWFAAATRSKTNQTRESPLYRILRLSILALTFALLFWKTLDVGILGHQIIPPIPTLLYIGFIACFAGLCLAIWARICLGSYWSDKVVLKVDHSLIRNGPYARMRHPIYSGVLLGILGTALVQGELRGVLAFAVLLVNYSIKARREEQILSAHFGHQFERQRKRTGFLLPRLRSGH